MFQHSRANITSRDNMLLVLDSGFNDFSVESIRNQTNDEIVLRNHLIQRFFVRNVTSGGMGTRMAVGEFDGIFNSSTC